MALDVIDFRLVNDWQRDFPLLARPYAELARRLAVDEDEIVARMRALAGRGVISRIGAVFRPHTLGWSTLAAVAVAPARIEAAARAISALPEVNHNYEREHAYNLWFVATAPTRERVAEVLARVGRETGSPVLDLPMLEDFHIDLGFDLAGRSDAPRRASGPHLAAGDGTGDAGRMRACLEPEDYALAAALEGGLAFTARPYAALAGKLGLDEAAVIARIERLLTLGVMRRFGVVVRHRELGYAANAMVVWDVPDVAVSDVGRLLARQQAVTLCYRRPRRPPDWPYNLFSMVHGRDRQAVLDEVARMRRELDLEHLACQPLFSRRRFKQCGARYSGAAASGVVALPARIGARPRAAEPARDEQPLARRAG